MAIRGKKCQNRLSRFTNVLAKTGPLRLLFQSFTGAAKLPRCPRHHGADWRRSWPPTWWRSPSLARLRRPVSRLGALNARRTTAGRSTQLPGSESGPRPPDDRSPHPLGRALPSTTSAGSCLPLFGRFLGTMTSSDVSPASMLIAQCFTHSRGDDAENLCKPSLDLEP